MRAFGDSDVRRDTVPDGAAAQHITLAAQIGNRAFAQLAQRVRIPFANRYAASGESTMSTIASGGGGLVHYPHRKPRRHERQTHQLSVIKGSR